jgi:hypothetical protein
VHRLQGLHGVVWLPNAMTLLASDGGNVAGPCVFLFDLRRLDSNDVAAQPLVDLKARLAELISDTGLPFSSAITRSPGVLPEGLRNKAREHGLQTRLCTLHVWNRGIWRKIKCPN